jgi:NitT/TauT family transport system substrate-binding protein
LIQKVNAPIRMFYQLSQLRFYPIVNTEHYQSWEDLDGADVAVHGRGSGTEAIMNLMAAQHGVTYNSISYVPGSAVRAGALLQGRLTASIVDIERYQLLQREAPGKFMALPLPPIEASDEALYANTEWLKEESEAVDILLEELIGVWREINEDPNSIMAMRNQYDLMPNLEQEDVDDILPSFTQGVGIDLYPNNGGGVDSVNQDFEFYTSSGTLEGDPAALKVEDYWYLDPLNTVLDRVGRI